jgi:hypothetical protein
VFYWGVSLGVFILILGVDSTQSKFHVPDASQISCNVSLSLILQDSHHRKTKSKTYNRVSHNFVFHATPVRDKRPIEMSLYITDRSDHALLREMQFDEGTRFLT